MRQAIVEAKSIDDVMDIRDKAEALRHYLKQVGEGLENQNMIAEIKLRAERKAGKLLKDMTKAKGGQPYQEKTSTGDTMSPVEPPPTLADIGISKKQSSRLQAVATLPEEIFETHIAETKDAKTELTSASVLEKAKVYKKEKDRAKKQEERKKTTVPVSSAVWHGDMRELGKRIESNSVDLILTDPPYPGEFLPLFSDLSTFAARVLKPGGLCLVYSGQIFLPEVMSRLCESLEYAWTFAIRHSGGNQRIFKVNVNTAWKPVLAFCKPPLTIWWDSFIDVVSGGREKDLHEWQQAESEAAYFIEHLTLPGQVVVDPFCGSGTVLKAAKDLGRQYQGIELNPEHIENANRRLSS